MKNLPFIIMQIIIATVSINLIFPLKSYLPVDSMTIEGNQWKIYKSGNFIQKVVNHNPVYILKENIEEKPSLLDLYLDFENPLKNIPNYKVIYSNYEQNKYQYVNGNYSGKFYFSDHYLSLLPHSTSIFAPGSIPGSFTIEFWLYLYKNYDNQFIIKYIGNNLSDERDKNIYGISIFTHDNRIIYRFDNIFWSENKEAYTIEIKDDESFELNKWEHHAVSFNILDGKMATFKNGLEQEVKWITSNGKILSPIFNPLIKDELSTPILIGQNAFFSIDNLKIKKDFTEQYYLKRYVNKDSIILTDIYKIAENRVTLKKLSFGYSLPEYSYIKMAYRISDHYFLPDSDDIKWIYFQNNIDTFPEEFQRGKFIQFKINAFPYEEMDKEILINSIKLDYVVDKDPYEPVIDEVDPMDEMIKIIWVPSPEDSVAGYEIYYGNRKEDYICDDAAEGKSPIFITNIQPGTLNRMSIVLSGLKNEKPYFIAIRTVDRVGNHSQFSREFYARPSSIYNDKKYSINR